MKFNKVMIDTLYEIRDTQHADIKSELKFSAPNIGQVLIKIYHETENIHIKALITIFMREAGQSWSQNLEQAIYKTPENSNPISKLPMMLSALKLRPSKR